VTTRKKGDEQPEEPTAEQLPAEDPADDPTVIDESPADEKGNRGKSEEAHANAPGQQKKDREDPNTYPDPENPPHTP
jgi:hypothetical protein